MKRTLLPLTIVCLVLLAGGWHASLAAQDGAGISDVRVTNFPDPMHVEGELTLKTSFVQTREAVVSPARIDQPTQMVLAGTLETEGFRHAVVSLSGELKGQPRIEGRIGALLVPEDATAIRAFEERGEQLFPLQTVTPRLTSDTQYFGSATTEFSVAFPRYRIYLFNATDKNASVRVSAYLTP